jgi:hypothetical protein
MLQRAQKSFKFSDGRQVIVQEANWDIAAVRDRIVEEVIARRGELKEKGDPELLYFHEFYYSSLASCSTGDVPDLQSAFHLPADDLDGWYQAVMDTNPQWFLETDQSAQEVVTFRDGRTLTVISANRPSVVMRRLHLETEAERNAPDKRKIDVFAWYIYPRLAGCTVGDIPSADELRREWPEAEIYKWTDAAKRVNPRWFGSPQESAERLQTETLQQEKKRKGKRRKS